MKERPILFSGPMVRAILEGRKTQTRRVVKGELAGIDPATYQPFAVRSLRWCPYGQPGDRLWVRENWAVRRDQDSTRISGIEPTTPWFPADGETPSGCGGGMGKTRPSIHMPRWASRITLEVTEVRVERVADIGANDAWAEGVSCYNDFKKLWDSINGQRPGCDWASNPWVWAVSFKRVEVKP